MYKNIKSIYFSPCNISSISSNLGCFFSKKCTGNESLLNICLTSEYEHHKAYLFRILSKHVKMLNMV